MPAPDGPPTPDAPTTQTEHRMAGLDGLRGAASIAVFTFHGWLYTMPGEPASINREGAAEYAVHELRLALVSFFVLSGFLLFRPWLKAALGAGDKVDVRAYARSRVARVAPAYYVALVGSIALLWGLAGTPGVRLPPAEELPLFFVFAQNFSSNSVLKLNPPMWSLTVEVVFYALLPLIGLLAAKLPPRRAAQAILPLVFVVGGISFNWAIAGEGLGLTASKSLPAMAPYFGIGMLTALVLHDRDFSAIRRRALLVCGSALVAADAIVKAGGPAGWFDPGEVFPIMRDLPSAFGFAMIILALATATRRGVMSGRFLAGMGTISYGFYLWHVPVMLVMRANGLLPLDPWLGTLAALGPSLALALVSWFVLERPAIRWAARRNRAEREERARRAASGRGDGGRRARGEVGAVRA